MEKLKLWPPGRPDVHQAVHLGSSISSAKSFQADLLWSEWLSLLGRRPEAPCRTSQPHCSSSDHTPWDHQHIHHHSVCHQNHKLCLLEFKKGMVASLPLLRSVCTTVRAWESMFIGTLSRCSEGKLSVPLPLPLCSALAAYLIVGRQVWWGWQRRPCSPLDQSRSVMAVWHSPALRWCNLPSRTANISDWALWVESMC